MLLAIVAVLLQNVPLFLLALLVLIASVVSRMWVKYALKKLEYSRWVGESHVFFGESVPLELSIANRKILPLPWVNVQDEIPQGVTFPEGKVWWSKSRSSGFLSTTLSLSWYHRITQRYVIECNQRGFFEFGPATVRSGDLFGFSYTDSKVEQRDQVIVYPKILPVTGLEIPPRHPVGELGVKKQLFEDPVLVMGVKDYTPGDPMRRIHWKLSAHRGKLQTKIFEPTTSADLAIFLDVRTVEAPFWGKHHDLLETAILTVASIGQEATGTLPVGLYVNDSDRNLLEPINLAPSSNPKQMQQMLEALARIQGFPIQAIEDLLSAKVRNLLTGTSVMVITAIPTGALLEELERIQRIGRSVALIIVGTSHSIDGQPKNVPVFRVDGGSEWRDFESVNLVRQNRMI